MVLCWIDKNTTLECEDWIVPHDSCVNFNKYIDYGDNLKCNHTKFGKTQIYPSKQHKPFERTFMIGRFMQFIVISGWLCSVFYLVFLKIMDF
jgi:hypothetical protein